MKNLILFLLYIFLVNIELHGQNVYIPDSKFKDILVNDSEINTNGDSEIQIEEAQVFTNEIWVNNKYIKDLTGIEAFVSIIGLDCRQNQITNIDLSSNTNLQYFDCSDNDISTLDLSNNLNLEFLSCRDNKLTKLDVHNNSNLEEIDCSNNEISDLGLAGNMNLKYLTCSNNYIVSLNLKDYIYLKSIECDNNQLVSLTLPKIYYYLDKRSNDLLYLECSYNFIESLDLSSNYQIDDLNCSDNNLNLLNLRNGTNTKLWKINAHENPDLHCVSVDDPGFSQANWADYFDKGISFGTNNNCVGIFKIYPNIGYSQDNKDTIDIQAYPVFPYSKVVFFNEIHGYCIPDSVVYIDSFNISVFLNFENIELGVYDVCLVNNTDTTKKGNAYTLINKTTAFDEWIEFEEEKGNVFTSGIYLPDAARIYCMLKKATHVGYSSTWSGGINLYYEDSVEFSKSKNTGDDILMILKNVKSGYYPFEIYSSLNKNWKGKIKFCIEPEMFALNEWNKAEVLRPYGYDWKVINVQEDIDSLNFFVEGYGLHSTLSIYYGYYGKLHNNWHFGRWKGGYQVQGTIINAKAGKYYLRYKDSAVLWESDYYSNDQSRQYLMYVGANTRVHQSPLELTVTKLSANKLNQAVSTVRVFGKGIRETDQIRLTEGNGLSVVGIRNDSVIKHDHVEVTFDLTDANEGNWFISVLRDGELIKFKDITVQVSDNKKIDIDFEIIARNTFRTGRYQPLIVRLTNKGGNDLHFIPVTLSLPKEVLVQVRNLQRIEVSTIDSFYSQDELPLKVDNYLDPNLNDVTLLIPFLAPAKDYELVFWLNPQFQNEFNYSVSVDDPLFYFYEEAFKNTPKSVNSSDPCEECNIKFDETMIERLEELKKEYSDINEDIVNCIEETDFHGYLREFILDNEKARNNNPLDYTIERIHELLNCKNIEGSEASRVADLYKDYFNYLRYSNIEFDCFDECNNDEKDEEYPKSRSNTGISHGSTTPEDKYGPLGVITSNNDSIVYHFVDSSQLFEYRVDYWNKEDATAPAAIVYIRDTLDSDFNLLTFNFTELGFLKWKVKLEGGQYFNVNVDCRPDMPYLVNVEGTVDPNSREAYWVFTTLDPQTMELPEDLMSGFLPPIDSTGYQIGWVNYTIEAMDSLPDGTVFTNQAFVNFDGVGKWGAAPKEGPFTNIFDLTNPISHVLPVSLVSETDSVLISWEGEDTGSGVEDYNIFVSEGEKYSIWKNNSSELSSYFIGENGKTYKFYSIAKDRVGNVETGKVNYEAVVSFEFINSVMLINSSNLFKVFPNPSSGLFTVQGHLNYDQPEMIKVFNYLGGLIYQVETISFETKIDLTGIPKGIYIIKIGNSKSIYNTKIVMF